MKKGFIHKIVLIAVLELLLFLPTYAQADRLWWQDDDEGWFFYKDTPMPEKAPEEHAIQNAPAAAPAPDDNLLESEKLRRHGEELLSNAMTTPTEENVKLFMDHNKRMMDMADNFQAMWQRVLMQNAELDYSAKDTSGKMQEAIRSLSERAGIFFLFNSTCPHCQQEAGVIKQLQAKYDFVVIAVSLDGGVLPEFPNAVPDNGISTRLSVDSVPVVFLAFPEEDRFERIASGFASLPDMEGRLYNFTTIDEQISNSGDGT